MPSLPGSHRFFVLGAFLCSQNSLYKLKKVLQNTRYMFILNICNSNVCIYKDTQMHTCRHIYIGNISIRIPIHTYTGMHVQILCAEPRVNMNPQMHPLRHINVHACTHTEIHTHSCTHTHTHRVTHFLTICRGSSSSAGNYRR